MPVKGDKLLPVSVEAIQYFYISNGLVKAVDSEGKEFVFSQSLDELAEQARELGANAVVGIDIDYEVLGEKNGMLMVSASGTAVVVAA